jgi:general stress protein 26
MADIDRQPHADLSGAAALDKLTEIAKNARMCMFATRLGQVPPDLRPMALQTVGDDGAIHFLSSTESDKNRDIAADPRVMLSFQNDDKSEYMVLDGDATVLTDRASIDEHWTALANAWFEGKDDPRVSVIRVRPRMGHYWDTQDGKIVQMAKMAFAAVTGRSSDGGVDGSLRV